MHFFFHFGKKVQDAVISEIDNEKTPQTNLSIKTRLVIKIVVKSTSNVLRICRRQLHLPFLYYWKKYRISFICLVGAKLNKILIYCIHVSENLHSNPFRQYIKWATKFAKWYFRDRSRISSKISNWQQMWIISLDSYMIYVSIHNGNGNVEGGGEA